MKLPFHTGLLASGLTLFALCGVVSPTHASKTNLLVSAKTLNPTSGPAAKAAPLTAAEIAAAPIPQSTFELPRKAVEGKDPFFPNATRVYGADPATKGKAPGIEAELSLKGISGTPEQPLAIINTTTFAAGEVNEVIHRNGRLKIQCLEINMANGTVLLQIGAERRELRINPGN